MARHPSAHASALMVISMGAIACVGGRAIPTTATTTAVVPKTNPAGNESASSIDAAATAPAGAGAMASDQWTSPAIDEGKGWYYRTYRECVLGGWGERVTALLVGEIQELEALVEKMPHRSNGRQPALLRIAMDYLDLERQAERRALGPGAVVRARQGAIQSFTTVVTESGDATSSTSEQDRSNGYNPLEFATYCLAYEHERAGDTEEARRGYATAFARWPAGGRAPQALLGLAELTFREAVADPSKWEQAKQAYWKVVANTPIVENEFSSRDHQRNVYAFAWYKLGYASWNSGDRRHALDAFRKAYDVATRYPTISGWFTDEAHKHLVAVYGLTSNPSLAFDFFMSVGENGDGHDRTIRITDELGRWYWASGRTSDMAALYEDLSRRDPAHRCRWLAHVPKTAEAVPSEADVERELKACNGSSPP